MLLPPPPVAVWPPELVLLPWLPYSARLGVFSGMIVFMTLCIYSLRQTPPGALRLLVSLPVMGIGLLVPLLFHPQREFLTLLLAEFTIARLAGLKVLAWVMNRGPLSKPWGLTDFVVLMLAPVIPEEGGHLGKWHRSKADSEAAEEQEETPTGIAARCAGKVLLIAGAVAALQLNMPQLAVELAYALGLYAFLSLFMDVLSALLIALRGLHVAPHFDQPWLASSLADFWSKRWDVVVGAAFRDALYNPILEGRLVHVEKRRTGRTKQRPVSSWRRLAGMAACFTLSAALHEMEYWYWMRRWSGGLYGGFFLAQIPLMILERGAYSLLRARGVEVPRLARIAVTLGVLLVTAHCTFWAPPIRDGIIVVAVAGVRANGALAAKILGLQ